MISDLGPRMRLGLILACATLAAPATAEPPPFPEFTFKRVKPPQPGEKRITVQITTPPVVAKPKSTAKTDVAVAAAAPRPNAGQHDWFWVAIEGGSPAKRVSSALNVLQRGPAGRGFPAPRLQALREIADRHGQAILKHSVGTRVSPAFALAVIAVESGGRTRAVSHAGAAGLMQLMPATAERFGVGDRTHADENIRGGITYLDWLMGEFAGDPLLALAGYNAGEGAVRKYGGVPPYAETRGYVPKVLAAWSVARGLCLTPPELITDGCVFVRARASTNG